MTFCYSHPQKTKFVLANIVLLELYGLGTIYIPLKLSVCPKREVFLSLWYLLDTNNSGVFMVGQIGPLTLAYPNQPLSTF